MKKFAVITTLIGVLALAACSDDEGEPGGADTEDADKDAE